MLCTDLLNSTLSGHAASRYSSPSLALSSILIPLPFVLTSLVQVSPFESASTMQEGEGGNTLNTHMQSRYMSFLGVCSLTAATLVLVGFFGELTGPKEAKQGRGPEGKFSSVGWLSIEIPKRIVWRILAVGLPLYAASKLGGERIALVILVTLAAELMPKNPKVEEVSRPGSWKRLIMSRKWTASALMMQCLSDLLNLTNSSLPLQTISGYLALTISVFLLPWPFPTSLSKSTDINSSIDEKGHQSNSTTGSWQVLGLTFSRSPMVFSAKDTDLTVASGVVATVTSFMVFVMSSQETQALTLGLLLGGSTVAIASAASLLFADSRALVSKKGIVLATGLGFSIVIQEIIDSHPLLPILFQGLLATLAWIGVYVDTHASHPHHHHHNHGHDAHTSHSHSHSEDPPSKFTSVLLKLFEDQSLIHSILIEKDSRRILYFMW